MSELLNLPLAKEVDHAIDLMLDAKSISRTLTDSLLLNMKNWNNE
jgi:hypothetical protein